jgi:glycerol-1-phosphate dehydrogenase [NAD(P)+]
MPEGVIADLIAGRWRDPDDGGAVSVPVKAVVIEATLAGNEADLVRGLGLGRRLAVVSDPVTHEKLGARVEMALASIATVTPVRLSDRPHADEATVMRLRAATASADALIAVGSGTINDLCKYAAFQDGKPYAVFGTAPSMNGYTSANAAITVGGLKKSLGAAMPAGVFLDLQVLAGAPPRMIRSGLGDSLCRPTAQADWLLSHLLRDTPYREAPFALLMPDEAALFDGAAALLRGDLEAMARLARTLVLSGFGMVICGGSYPASEGEHLISHYAEMMGNGAFPDSFHGEQIGVTTLTMARLQERMLELVPRIAPTQVDAVDISAHFGPETGAACIKELAAKMLDARAADALNARIAARWGEVREAIATVLRPVAVLERALAAAGAPTSAAELGWPAAFYRDAVLRARQIRNRFTFLDLAGDAGMLAAFAQTESQETAA